MSLSNHDDHGEIAHLMTKNVSFAHFVSARVYHSKHFTTFSMQWAMWKWPVFQLHCVEQKRLRANLRFFRSISKPFNLILGHEFKSRMCISLIPRYATTDMYLCTPKDLIVLPLLDVELWCISLPLSAKQHDVLMTTPTASTQLFLSVCTVKTFVHFLQSQS